MMLVRFLMTGGGREGRTSLRRARLPALRVTATVRASFGVYNGYDDVDSLVAAVETAKSYFGVDA